MASCKDCIHNHLCLSADDTEYIDFETLMYDCKKFINKADVVKVVRCKDCKHWIYWADQKRCSCIKHHIQSNSYDFCNYGELKELGK